MTAVLDANILLRLSAPTSPQHAAAAAAVAILPAGGYILRTLPQTLYEYWVAATRPVANNGLGSSIAECAAAVAGFVRAYPLLDDPPGLCAEWQTLVAADNCRGKVAHDARYVAAMRLHTLTHILTFNGSDFARFPGVTVLDPAAVAAGSAGPTPRS